MFMIAGLGNPGKEYENTRHNVGFQVIDRLAEELGIQVNEKKHFALCGKGLLAGQRVLLLKPQTYMNNSGQSIRAAADFYQIPPEQILVVSDDINLPQGQLRLRLKGSAGGHNGLKSIIAHLGSQDFPRLRVGVGGKPEGWDLADYVLGKLKGNDAETMDEAFRKAAEAVKYLVEEGGEAAQNKYNQKPPKPPKAPKQQKPRKQQVAGDGAEDSAVAEQPAGNSAGDSAAAERPAAGAGKTGEEEKE